MAPSYYTQGAGRYTCRNFSRPAVVMRSNSRIEVLYISLEQALHLGVICGEPVNQARSIVRPLFMGHNALVGGKPAMLPCSVSWAEVAELPLCLLSQEIRSRFKVDEAFQGAGVRSGVMWMIRDPNPKVATEPAMELWLRRSRIASLRGERRHATIFGAVKQPTSRHGHRSLGPTGLGSFGNPSPISFVCRGARCICNTPAVAPVQPGCGLASPTTSS
jgi:hypothetical protein